MSDAVASQRNTAAYWRQKIAGNLRRDRRIRRMLFSAGIRTIRIWGIKLELMKDRCADELPCSS
jgi:G:T-mismatch repair DNA endonuclease (very short patch repair protein)